MSSRNRVAAFNLSPVPAPPDLSPRAARACAAFSILPKPTESALPAITAPSRSLLDWLPTPGITLIVGPSGAGKSSLLRGIARALGSDPNARVHTVAESLTPQQSTRAVFDLFDAPAEQTAATLARAGLAEPALWARPAACLSVGEQARLRLALAMHTARPGDTVIADELASTIDRAGAYALCATVRRWARQSCITLIAAGAHEDLAPMLAPDLVIDAATQTPRPPPPALVQPITIAPGTLDNYRALAHLHYRAGPPASVVRVLRAVRHVPTAVEPTGEVLAGVLTVSMPTLNAAWRDRAWPGVFRTGDKSRDARALNRRLRTISRVVVEPRSRGLGIATALVRAYLRDPLTEGTEAQAAMGPICPFFERAGMTPYALPPSITDTRLLDALAHLNLSLADLMHAAPEPGSLLAREIQTWARARKLMPAGPATHAQITRLTPIAACRLCARPRAYAFTGKDTTDDDRPHHKPDHQSKTVR